MFSKKEKNVLDTPPAETGLSVGKPDPLRSQMYILLELLGLRWDDTGLYRVKYNTDSAVRTYPRPGTLDLAELVHEIKCLKGEVNKLKSKEGKRENKDEIDRMFLDIDGDEMDDVWKKLDELEEKVEKLGELAEKLDDMRLIDIEDKQWELEDRIEILEQTKTKKKK